MEVSGQLLTGKTWGGSHSMVGGVPPYRLWTDGKETYYYPCRLSNSIRSVACHFTNRATSARYAVLTCFKHLKWQINLCEMLRWCDDGVRNRNSYEIKMYYLIV